MSCCCCETQQTLKLVSPCGGGSSAIIPYPKNFTCTYCAVPCGAGGGNFIRTTNIGGSGVTTVLPCGGAVKGNCMSESSAGKAYSAVACAAKTATDDLTSGLKALLSATKTALIAIAVFLLIAIFVYGFAKSR